MPTTIPQTVSTRSIEVMLVDDHPLVREGLRAVLDSEPDIRLVGEASSGAELFAALESGEARPRVILMDIKMPELSGVEVVREMTRRYPDIACVMLTIYDSESYLAESIAAGAKGYLLKDQPRELVALAIRTVAEGGTVVPPAMLGRLIESWPGRSGATPAPFSLSPREVEILGLIARGCSNRAIAEQLHLAETTIKKYVQSLTGKLGASDRGHAAILGLRLGIVE